MTAKIQTRFKQLAGFGNPYQSQVLPVPRARG